MGSNRDHTRNCKGLDKNRLLRAEEILEHLWMVGLAPGSHNPCMCMGLEGSIQSCNRKSIIQHSFPGLFLQCRYHYHLVAVEGVGEEEEAEEGRQAVAVVGLEKKGEEERGLKQTESAILKRAQGT